MNGERPVKKGAVHAAPHCQEKIKAFCGRIIAVYFPHGQQDYGFLFFG